MGILKALGKNELKELGCNFVVANVPIFASVSDPKKTNHMTSHKFKSLNEVKEFITKNTPVVVFDLTGVYKNTADIENLDDGYVVRCCALEKREFETLRSNLKESETLNFSYTFDFSCWFNNNK
jgi:hypothetical protein